MLPETKTHALCVASVMAHVLRALLLGVLVSLSSPSLVQYLFTLYHSNSLPARSRDPHALPSSARARARAFAAAARCGGARAPPAQPTYSEVWVRSAR